MNAFLTVEDVAVHLRVKPRRVYELVRSGELKAAKIGQHWRVGADDLAEYETAIYKAATILNTTTENQQ